MRHQLELVGWPFMLQDCGKSDFIVLLCTFCEVITGVTGEFNALG